MVARRYQDLIAFQLADEFKREIIRLVQRPQAALDLRYRSQLVNAATSVAANIVEGFLRHSPGQFAHYLAIAIGSLGEAEVRLRDGILLKHFTEADCALALPFAKRCATATVRLKVSQEEYARSKRKKGRR